MSDGGRIICIDDIMARTQLFVLERYPVGLPHGVQGRTPSRYSKRAPIQPSYGAVPPQEPFQKIRRGLSCAEGLAGLNLVTDAGVHWSWPGTP